MRVLRFVAFAVLGGAALGCNPPPDIDVYAYSDMTGSADVAVWRVRHGYRLKPRMVEPLDWDWGTFAGPAQFRVTPLGDLPAFAWVRIDIERHAPKFRSAAPCEMTVYTQFAAGQHLRLEAWFTDAYCDPVFIGGTGGGGTGGGGAGCGTPPPGCAPATVADGAMAEGPPDDPVSGDDVDQDETPFIGDPPPGAPSAPSVPSCAFTCPTLPTDDGSRQPHAMPPDHPGDAGADSGMEASRDAATDIGFPSFDGGAVDVAMGPDAMFPSVCNGFDNDCDGRIDMGPCPDGQICNGSECIAMCVEGACFGDQTCAPDGTCVAAGCVGVACPLGQTCEAGTCFDPCAYVSACAPGQVCRLGQCFNPCPGG